MVEKELIMNYPRERIVALMHEASFKKHDSEAIYVGNIVYGPIRSKDIIPMVTEHQGLQLAARGIVGIGFFREYMEHLNQYRGYPKVEFYMGVCKKELKIHGKEDIADNMENWTNHLHTIFQPSLEVQEEIIQSKGYETCRYHKTFSDPRQWKRPGFLSDN